MARLQRSRKRATQHGRNKFAGLEGKNVAIGEPTKLKIRGDRLTAGGNGVRRIPVRFAFDIEMLKRTGPIFDSIAAHDAVPMQLIDWEAGFFRGAEGTGQADVFDVRFRAKSGIAEAHGYAPGHES